jgi:hypothetical protein
LIRIHAALDVHWKPLEKGKNALIKRFGSSVLLEMFPIVEMDCKLVTKAFNHIEDIADATSFLCVQLNQSYLSDVTMTHDIATILADQSQ